MGSRFLDRVAQDMSVYSSKSMPTLAWGSTNELVFGAGRWMSFSASGEGFSVKHKSGRSITARGRDSAEGASEFRLGVSPPANEPQAQS